jgi:hypothetical protein
MREKYLKLKQDYVDKYQYLSTHAKESQSFRTVHETPNKTEFIPTIISELETNPGWFDILIISYIIHIPTEYMPFDSAGRFQILKVFYINYLKNWIRKNKLTQIENGIWMLIVVS